MAVLREVNRDEAHASPVTYGLSIPNRAVMFGYPPQSLLRLAKAAEESGGFDSVWVGDNFLTRPRLEAIVLLGALSTITQRVKLGTVCLATFPMRNPLQFAIEWASLDLISGGRTILCVCNGGSSQDSEAAAIELAAMGVRSEDRAGRVEEGVELLRKLWSDAPVNHQGRFYQYRLGNVQVYPKPIQERIPIMIAVTPPQNASPRMEERILRRVARLGDGWQSAICAPLRFKRYWHSIKEYAAEYGRASHVTHASYHLMVNINESASSARTESIKSLESYYGGGFLTDEMLAAFCAYGPPHAVAERISEYLDAGCTTPIIRFMGDDQLGQLERCVNDVLPLLRTNGGG